MIVEMTFTENKITESTIISCRFGNFINHLADFKKCGYKTNGLTEIKNA